MSTFQKPPLDFDVIKEIWNTYELSDHSIIKVKIVLTRVHKTAIESTDQSPKYNYSLDFQHIVVILTDERGEPDTRTYSQQELQTSIIKDDIRYDTSHQDWNEYVAHDGTRIKIQPMVSRVAKTSKFDAKGIPVYWVDLNMSAQIKPVQIPT